MDGKSHAGALAETRKGVAEALGRHWAAALGDKDKKGGAKTDSLEDLLKLDDLSLEVGYALVPLVDAGQGGQLLARVKSLRSNLAVQLGFVAGTLISALANLPDVVSPRLLFAVCALLAAVANALFAIFARGAVSGIALRFATGMLLAGVYPVGM